MATRAQKVKAGAFLITSVAVIGAALAVALGVADPARVNYIVEFDESVLGLNAGGLVEYMGVPVGTVRNIRVSEDNLAIVLIEIDPAKVSLRKGVRARLVIYSLAMGTMCISLTGGEPDAPELPEYYVIPTDPSVLESVSSQVEEILSDFGDIGEKLNFALEGLEEGELVRVVRNADRLLVETREAVKNTSETVEGLRQDLRGLDDTLASVREAADAISGWSEVAQANLESLDLGALEQDVRAMLQSVTDTTGDLVRILEQASRATAHQVDNFEHDMRRTLGSLREAMDSVSNLTEMLERDPASVIRGRGAQRRD